jgi:adenylosuccinate lyase
VRLRTQVAVGKVSGAVGTYANIDPRIEAITCELLGLQPDTVSTQVISRDRHAEYIQELALLAASIERFAVEIRNLQRTDVLEVEEFFSQGQKGSSAMPHKRNPIRSERLSGLARIIRGHAIAALENVVLWHERDISHSSVERMILPDSAVLTHFMLVEITDLVKHLLVYPHNMTRNMNVYGGVVFSQRVMLALVEKGMRREEAYKIVQSCAHVAWNQPDGNFRSQITQNQQVQEKLSPQDIEVCFDPSYHLKHLDEIYQRLNI